MTRTFLTARFDVTDLNEEERGQLALEVVVQHEPSDGHPGIEAPELEWDEIEEEVTEIIGLSQIIEALEKRIAESEHAMLAWYLYRAAGVYPTAAEADEAPIEELREKFMEDDWQSYGHVAEVEDVVESHEGYATAMREAIILLRSIQEKAFSEIRESPKPDVIDAF